MATEERTPSKADTGSKLLDTCLDILEERKPEQALKEAIQHAQKELREMQDEFESTIQEQPPNIQQECMKDVEYAQECFKAYFESIGEIEKYFETHDKFDIVRGAEKVRSSTTCLNTAFLNYRNKALIAMGPTDIPVLNLVLDTYDKITKAEQEDIKAYCDKLIHIIQREHITVHRAFPELNREKLLPEEELLKRAYEKHQAACFAIRDAIKEPTGEGLIKAVEDYSQAAKSIKDIIPAVNLKRMTQVPTTSPQTNLVINLSRTIESGTGTDEMFLEALKALEEDFNNTKMQFEAVKRHPTDSVLLKEELPKAEKAIAAFESGITDYYRFLEVRDTLLLKQAAAKLEDATKQIKKCSEVFHGIAEREGKTPCIRCSHYNPPNRKTCEECGAVLPASAETEEARTFELGEQDQDRTEAQEDEIIMTENVYKLFDAVNKVSEGQIPMEEFRETVDWMEGLVMEARKVYGPIPAVNVDAMKDDLRDHAKQLIELMDESKELFKEGTDDVLMGLNFFRQYVQQGDKNNLVLGVQVIWQGIGKVQKVQKVTGFFKEVYEETRQGKK